MESTHHATEITSDENFVKSKINVCDDVGESDRDGHAAAATAGGFLFFFFFEPSNCTPG
jgi:hypothetical protein